MFLFKEKVDFIVSIFGYFIIVYQIHNCSIQMNLFIKSSQWCFQVPLAITFSSEKYVFNYRTDNFSLKLHCYERGLNFRPSFEEHFGNKLHLNKTCLYFNKIDHSVETSLLYIFLITFWHHSAPNCCKNMWV